MENFSYWEKSVYFKSFDFIIVGAGITGLVNALLLHKKYPKKKILILEKNLIGAVATTKNAGFACIGAAGEIASDIQTYGADEAFKNVERRFKGLEILFSLVSKEKINYKSHGGNEIFDTKTQDNFQLAIDKMDEMNHLMKFVTKSNDFYTLKNDLLPTYGLSENFNQLIRIKDEGQIHSGLLQVELEKSAINSGVIILKGVEVLNYEKIQSSFSLQTSTRNFSCNQLILCTNALFNALNKTQRINPGRGLVLVSQALKKQKLSGSFHYNAGYTYFRGVENRILLGGGRDLAKEEESIFENGVNPSIKEYLEGFLMKIAPHEKDIRPEYFWSGIMAFTENKQPILQKGLQGEIFCAGMNGMGIAIASACAKEVVELVVNDA